MKKKRIILRADGNLIAGYGHVIRALSLASMLRHKYHTVFIIQKPDDFLRVQILKTCAEIIEIPVSTDLITESKKIAKTIINFDDIVVLDGYGYDLNYQKAIKKNCFKLICIDDIQDRKFVADVIINHSEGIKKQNYSVEKFSAIYLGTHYAILRRSFLKKATERSTHKIIKHKAFISMGGTDQQNYTQKALKVCINNNAIAEIDIVVGSFYPYLKELEYTIRSNKQIRIKVYSNLSEEKISSLMKKSTIAICSASTVSYEYASIGGLLFLYQTVPNQKNIYAFMIRSKVAFPVKTFDTVLTSFSHKTIAADYFTNRKNYFSCDSSKNLLEIFLALEKERGITIRLAKQKDLLTYFKWVNDNQVRANSVNTAHIKLDSHTKWFLSKLKDKNSALFIIEKNGIPLGQVRIDKTDDVGEIDYSIEKKYRGKGYGEIILKNAIKKYFLWFPKSEIVAKVKESNTSSNRIFEKLGFKKIKPILDDGTKYYRYNLKSDQ